MKKNCKSCSLLCVCVSFFSFSFFSKFEFEYRSVVKNVAFGVPPL